MRLVTAAEVVAFREELIAAMPGWERPQSYALGVRHGDEPVDWRVVNDPCEHVLPAAVLSTILGYRRGSATYVLDLATFDAAIALLEPAGACEAFEHPNLWAWQALRKELSGDTLPRGTEVVVEFVGASA